MNVVPTSRLAIGVAVAAALSVLGLASPELDGVWTLGLAGWVCLALADFAWSWQNVRPPTVELPPLLRFAANRPIPVPVTFRRQPGAPTSIRFALGFPAGFHDAEEHLAIQLPSEVERSQALWTTTATRRGRFREVLAVSEISSRLGLWSLRSRQTIASELRVYPDLMTERRAMASLFLDRARFGAKLQRTVGRGRDFEKLREYLPGDGFDEVHWKATAKRGHPITKVFQAERTQEIYVVIDGSRLSARPVEQDGVVRTVLDRYLSAALVLLLAAERQGDRFGLVTFSAGVDVFLRAGRGRSHYGACREAVHALEPDPGTPDPAEIVRALRTRLRQRALLFFLTDLSDPVLAEEFSKHLRPLARQHLVLVNQLRPPEVGPLFSGAEIADTAELPGRLAGHVRWAELRATAQALRPLGVTAQVLDNEALAARLVTQYLEVKQRQAL
jgi:uncharacterized protein (DUF58 family)